MLIYELLNFKDQVKALFVNELNNKRQADTLIQKYEIDSGKIESELNDLEIVVEDLREMVLKHKCNVNIDDVECYALALSQLSKQLVGLKSSFSSIREQLRSYKTNE